jgi:hypothetical protein
MPSTQYEPGTELNCLVEHGEGSPVRGFLTLPGTDISGELRLASDLPAPVALDDVVPLRFVLQDVGADVPGCISNGFLVHHEVRLPTPPAFPLRIHVNEVVLGVEDPDTHLGEGFLDCKDLLGFFRTPEIKLGDAAEQDLITKTRLTLPFGDLRLKVEETSQRDVGESSLAVDFTARLSLQGEARTAHSWASPLTRAIGFFSFCLDRPMGFDWIGASQNGDRVTLFASWRSRTAPTNTVPILRSSSVNEEELAVAATSWSDLWTQAPPLMDHIQALQMRRDGLTIDDRLMVLTRTLELYHRHATRFQSAVRSPSENKELREAILSCLPDSTRTAAPWLGDAINEANRKRLSLLLEEILDDLGPEVAKACGISGRASTFAKSVARARNFFTHPKKKVRKGIPHGLELLEMVHRLWFIVRACVLVELGFPRTFIASALTESARRHYLVHGRRWAQG